MTKRNITKILDKAYPPQNPDGPTWTNRQRLTWIVERLGMVYSESVGDETATLPFSDLDAALEWLHYFLDNTLEDK